MSIEVEQAASAVELAQQKYEAALEKERKEAAEREALEREERVRALAARVHVARATMRAPRGAQSDHSPWETFLDEVLNKGAEPFAAWRTYATAMTAAREYQRTRQNVIDYEHNLRNQQIIDTVSRFAQRLSSAVGNPGADRVNVRTANEEINAYLREQGLTERDVDSSYPPTLEEFGGERLRTVVPTLVESAGLTFHAAMEEVAQLCSVEITRSVRNREIETLDTLAAAAVEKGEIRL